MLRRLLVLLALPVALSLAIGRPAAGASVLDADLASTWSTVITTPDARNPFGSGGQKYACIDLGNDTVAPLGPNGVESCTVGSGTAIFVTGHTNECSTFEGYSLSDLRTCAIEGDSQSAPTITVDGAPRVVSGAETGLLSLTLPAHNIFQLPAGTRGYSYGHGWATLVSPLATGKHTIQITDGSTSLTTTINVTSN